MPHDIRTIVVVAGFVSLITSLLGISVWLSGRTHPGFGRWTLGMVGLAVSLLFASVRHLFPDPVSVIFSNTVSFTTAILFLEGTRQFRGLRARHWLAYAAAGVSLALQVYFVAGPNNLGARILVFSAYMGAFDVATAATLLRGVPSGRRLGFLFTGTVFAVQGASHFARGAFALEGGTLFGPSLVNTTFYLVTVLAVIGWVFGFMMLTKDRLVTELVAAEQRAAQADAVKSAFLAHMSHEIRTPLSGVLGLTSLVLDGPLTEAKRPDLKAAQESAESLIGVINDILDLSKMDAGHVALTIAPFDLHDVLVNIVALFRPQAAAKGIALQLSYPQTGQRWFEGDGLRVRQIIANFTSNAVKFTARGGVTIRMDEYGGMVRLSVQDTGAGIASELLPRLFTDFIQADASIASTFGGTGLGLAISRRLAEMMMGRVGVTTAPGCGATFWVDLPLRRTAAPIVPAVCHHAQSRDFRGARVLVAEDNIVNQRVLVRLLQKHGVLVDVASTGQEAIALYRETDYALILMDCEMPDLDGYHTTRLIRASEDEVHRHIPIVAITAHAFAGERERCAAAGMDDYLVKPIQQAILLDVLAAHCAQPAVVMHAS